MSNNIDELDDLLVADVMSDVIEESTKEAVDVEPGDGELGTICKTNAVSRSQPENDEITHGMCTFHSIIGMYVQPKIQHD